MVTLGEQSHTVYVGALHGGRELVGPEVDANIGDVGPRVKIQMNLAKGKCVTNQVGSPSRRWWIFDPSRVDFLLGPVSAQETWDG
jgi:hypothetical protein